MSKSNDALARRDTLPDLDIAALFRPRLDDRLMRSVTLIDDEDHALALARQHGLLGHGDRPGTRRQDYLGGCEATDLQPARTVIDRDSSCQQIGLWIYLADADHTSGEYVG